MPEKIDMITERLIENLEAIVKGDEPLSLKDMIQIVQLLIDLVKLTDSGGGISGINVSLEGETDEYSTSLEIAIPGRRSGVAPLWRG